MKKRVFIVFIVALALTIGSVLVSWANVPPPPVNQFLGIPDSVFDTITTPECRACHNTSPPIPAVDPTYLPTRHHMLIGTTVTCPTDAPNVDCTVPTNPVPSTYGCYECHSVICDPGPPVVCNLAPFDQCNYCHTQQVNAPTVHHRTDLAQAQDCKACHGSLIDNPWAWEDAQTPPVTRHYIPTYPISMVTPRVGLGQTTGPLGDGQGGCAYCHEAGANTTPPVTVYTNAQTHHTIGLALPIPDPAVYGGKCLWCHDLNPGNTDDIRTCEQCHSVSSLHNIQTDSNGSGTITPGTELSYYGHIGNNTDCNGCHLNVDNQPLAAAEAPTYAIVPNISGLSVSNFTAGADTIVAVSGSAFDTNTVTYPPPYGTIEYKYKTNVVLTAADGSTTTLTPLVITESSMDVTIPGTLAAGNYDLRAVKSDKASNLVVISVKPPVVINSAICSNGVVTIAGSGFSEYLNAVDSGTSVSLTSGKGRNKTTTTCTVNSWNDTQIVANCGTCDGLVTVNSVFGSNATNLGGGKGNGKGKNK